MEGYLKRIEKYKRKIEAKFTDDNLKEMMVKNYEKFIKDFYPLDEAIRKILNRYEIIGSQRIFYHSFAREIYKIKRRHKNKTQKIEMKIIFNKWFSRKLQKRVLLAIKRKVEKYLFPQ